VKLCKCGKHMRHGNRCLDCYPVPQRCDERDSAAKRGYDRRWQQLRERYLAEHPLCETCEAIGRTTAAIDVHHVVPVRADPSRRLDWTNLRAVCKACHAVEEAVSRRAGVGGGRVSE
jgi:5-methylcytosine-specific restriction protein A